MRARAEATCCRDAEVEKKGVVGIAPAADDGSAHAVVSCSSSKHCIR